MGKLVHVAIAGALAVVAMATQSAMATDSGIALGVIDVTPSTGGVSVEARVIAVVKASITGEMQIERSGKSGSVSTRQSSQLELAPGETGRIAEVGVSYAPGDHLTITLTLRTNNSVVARTVLSTGG